MEERIHLGQKKGMVHFNIDKSTLIKGNKNTENLIKGQMRDSNLEEYKGIDNRLSKIQISVLKKILNSYLSLFNNYCLLQKSSHLIKSLVSLSFVQEMEILFRDSSLLLDVSENLTILKITVVEYQSNKANTKQKSHRDFSLERVRRYTIDSTDREMTVSQAVYNINHILDFIGDESEESNETNTPNSTKDNQFSDYTEINKELIAELLLLLNLVTNELNNKEADFIMNNLNIKKLLISNQILFDCLDDFFTNTFKSEEISELLLSRKVGSTGGQAKMKELRKRRSSSPETEQGILVQTDNTQNSEFKNNAPQKVPGLVKLFTLLENNKMEEVFLATTQFFRTLISKHMNSNGSTEKINSLKYSFDFFFNILLISIAEKNPLLQAPCTSTNEKGVTNNINNQSNINTLNNMSSRTNNSSPSSTNFIPINPYFNLQNKKELMANLLPIILVFINNDPLKKEKLSSLVYFSDLIKLMNEFFYEKELVVELLSLIVIKTNNNTDSNIENSLSESTSSKLTESIIKLFYIHQNDSTVLVKLLQTTLNLCEMKNIMEALIEFKIINNFNIILVKNSSPMFKNKDKERNKESAMDDSIQYSIINLILTIVENLGSNKKFVEDIIEENLLLISNMITSLDSVGFEFMLTERMIKLILKLVKSNKRLSFKLINLDAFNMAITKILIITNANIILANTKQEQQVSIEDSNSKEQINKANSTSNINGLVNEGKASLKVNEELVKLLLEYMILISITSEINVPPVEKEVNLDTKFPVSRGLFTQKLISTLVKSFEANLNNVDIVLLILKLLDFLSRPTANQIQHHQKQVNQRKAINGSFRTVKTGVSSSSNSNNNSALRRNRTEDSLGKDSSKRDSQSSNSRSNTDLELGKFLDRNSREFKEVIAAKPFLTFLNNDFMLLINAFSETLRVHKEKYPIINQLCSVIKNLYIYHSEGWQQNYYVNMFFNNINSFYHRKDLLSLIFDTLYSMVKVNYDNINNLLFFCGKILNEKSCLDQLYKMLGMIYKVLRNKQEISHKEVVFDVIVQFFEIIEKTSVKENLFNFARLISEVSQYYPQEIISNYFTFIVRLAKKDFPKNLLYLQTLEIISTVFYSDKNLDNEEYCQTFVSMILQLIEGHNMDNSILNSNKNQSKNKEIVNSQSLTQHSNEITIMLQILFNLSIKSSLIKNLLIDLTFHLKLKHLLENEKFKNFTNLEYVVKGILVNLKEQKKENFLVKPAKESKLQNMNIRMKNIELKNELIEFLTTCRKVRFYSANGDHREMYIAFEQNLEFIYSNELPVSLICNDGEIAPFESNNNINEILNLNKKKKNEYGIITKVLVKDMERCVRSCTTTPFEKNKGIFKRNPKAALCFSILQHKTLAGQKTFDIECLQENDCIKYVDYISTLIQNSMIEEEGGKKRVKQLSLFK